MIIRRVLAIGGGGFLSEENSSPIDRYLVRLVAKDLPRVCFVSTPGGDLPEAIEKFYATYEGLGCSATHLAFFRKPFRNSLPLADFDRHLLAQDAIFVGGGNTKSALAVWREWGLDESFSRASEKGILLSGMSAGAMCWFARGLTDSYRDDGLRPTSCLGILQGGCCVYFNRAPERRTQLEASLRDGTLPSTVAIDDSQRSCITMDDCAARRYQPVVTTAMGD